jgi:hypothetical protein
MRGHTVSLLIAVYDTTPALPSRVLRGVVSAGRNGLSRVA